VERVDELLLTFSNFPEYRGYILEMTWTSL